MFFKKSAKIANFFCNIKNALFVSPNYGNGNSEILFLQNRASHEPITNQSDVKILTWQDRFLYRVRIAILSIEFFFHDEWWVEN